jgi:uncharacterized protein (TIGR04255 family)
LPYEKKGFQICFVCLATEDAESHREKKKKLIDRIIMAKKYKKTFLKQVLVRVDFQNVLTDYEKGLNPAVTKTIHDIFPTLVEHKNKHLNVKVEKTTQSITTIEQTLWTYYAKDRKKHTRIEPTDFYIQYDKYGTFEQLKKDFQLVFNALLTSYGERNITRIGLRYIDEIEIEMEHQEDVFDWKEYLNPNLFSALSVPPKKDRKFISRAFSNLEFNYGDHNLILKYGMFNPDYPSPIKKKVFILDSDAFKKDNVPDNEICDVLEDLHSRISDLFENSLIKNGLRKIMDGR